MENLPPIDDSNSFFKINFSDFCLGCCEDRKFAHSKHLMPGALSPQPRSLASSEFSDLSSKGGREMFKWRTEDDANLMEQVNLHNHNWKIISNSFPNIPKLFLIKRWEELKSQKLRPYTWTKQEEELLLSLYANYNTNWKKISEFMPNRSISSLKNKFYELTNKRNLNEKSAREENKAMSPRITLVKDIDSTETMGSTEMQVESKSPMESRENKMSEMVTDEEKRKKLNELHNAVLFLKAEMEKKQEILKKMLNRQSS